MPKPRTWKTAFKHFGTIISHPQQYYRYKTNKAAFVQQDHLALQGAYAAEPGVGHPYPHAHGATIRETGVIYPAVPADPAVDAATRVVGSLAAHPVFDHQAHEGVAAHHLGADRDTLVVMRQEPGTGTTIRAAKKRAEHADLAFPDIGRTQHTTLTGALPVAAAAIHDAANNRLLIASGHYQPGDNAAVKLAIAGKQTHTISRRAMDFVDPFAHGGPQVMNMTMKRRMEVVSAWATRNPALPPLP
jgi:hypothetical protein